MQANVARRTVLAATGAGLIAAAAPLSVRAAERKWKIDLSNSFIGNKWRLEMVDVFKAGVQMEPYKSTVEARWFNSGNNVSQQTQQLTGMIGERVDAIVIDAASPTGLNGILTEATSRGIVVVSFDNVVTAPSVLKVNTDQFAWGKQLAEFLTKKLNGNGNVIMVTGVAGTFVDEQRNAGADSVWKANPGIKVVNRYTGMWDSSVAERNTAAILPSLTKVDGIWCQGGTDGVLKAFIAAKRVPLPVTAGADENGFRRFMTKEGYLGQHVDGLSMGQPPYLVLVSLELARRILNKTYPRKDITIPFPYATNETIKVGQNVFLDLPDSLFDSFTDSGPNAVVKLCVDAALKGTPCPGRLTVRLPPV